jgi:hypothetical protein
MANEKEPTPGTRGFRINQIRTALQLKREEMAEALAAVAERHKVVADGDWTATRVSRLILGRQPMTLDDAAVIVIFARERGLKGMGWDWLVLGTPAERVQVAERTETKVKGRGARGRKDAG